MSQTEVRYVPAEPAKLVLGDRQVAVDDWPLARSAPADRAIDLLRDDGDVLEVGPASGAGRKVAGATLVTLLMGVLPAAAGLALGVPWWLMAVAVALVAGLVALAVRGSLRRLTWVRFDRGALEVVTERRAGFRAGRVVADRLPVASVLAVQLLYSGHHTSFTSTGDPERPTTESRDYYAYELNLVIDGPAGGRRLLFASADWAWLRSLGTRLGEFLGVPVIDRLHHG
jgi:hypothetical protein